MNKEELQIIAKQLIEPGKGILAIDESHGTCKKRFEARGVECTEENRRLYRQLLVTTPKIEESVSGYILFDETIRQKTDNGIPFPEILRTKGVLPGIKVDEGKVPLSEDSKETITQGLEGLTERLEEYKTMGAKFAKWRAAFIVSDTLPSDEAIKENCSRLAQYAKICQEANIVPIVEPEVLIDGGHSIDRCEEVTVEIWKELFVQLEKQEVYLPGCLLKTSMIISGKDADNRASREEVAQRTVKALKETIPHELAGVIFLSGGQGDIEATEHLNLMNQEKDLPWPLTFSYGRSIQRPALDIWTTNMEQDEEAQMALLHRANANGLASKGEWTKECEK